MQSMSSRKTVRRRGIHPLALTLGLVAASLVVASALHLSGIVHGRAAPYDASDAGTAEALIAVALGYAATSLERARPHAKTIAVGALLFAIAGFIVGLIMTARGGHAPDIVYHSATLPVLVASLVVAARLNRPAFRA